MGEHEDWAQPSGLFPNGLLPNEEVCMIRMLDSERWLRAERRIAELIARIQPNQPSEERRKAVADYVQRMIMKCFPCQVFTFGSVPLKTYLPDGDIDLTAFSNDQGLKDTWAYQVRDMLENEEKNENAEFHVKEVQYIQAEVKLIKCLVENIVVDISFNQLGGLCTLCFLEEVDHLINHDHLFKRSVILIKAWCYYESRILGAHHGLISTYALETLVLYIFHVYNNSFVGPLEVLYRFLEFFSNFDWDNLCLSLWGPVPISSLPDVTAEPPRKDKGDLLLSKLFLDACSSVYAVFPGGQENQGQPFVSKHFNVIDPLRINNNLGRSVSKGNFYRIRSAFAFGAKKLAKILDCPEENLVHEVNTFFLNTWDRYGSGPRPDASHTNLLDSNLQDVDKQQESENIRNNMKNRKSIQNTSSGHGTAHAACSSRHVVDKCGNSHTEGISRVVGAGVSRGPSQKGHGSANSSYRREVKQGNFVEGTQTHTAAKCVKAGFSANDNQGRYLFARTHSSPELTNSYGEVSSREGHRTVVESGKHQSSLARVGSSKRKNLVLDASSSHMIFPSSKDHSMPKNFTSHNVLQSGSEYPNNYPTESRVCDELPSLESHEMHQEEQDFINMLAYNNFHSFNGHSQIPVNLPFPVFSSMNASMGYGHRTVDGGGVSPSISIIEPFWGPNMQFAQGYYNNAAVTTNLNDLDDASDEHSGSVDMKEGDHELWHKQDRVSTGGFASNSGNIEVPHFVDDIQQTYPAGHNVSYGRNNSNYMRLQPKFAKMHRSGSRNDNVGSFHHERGNESNEAVLEEKISSRVSCDGRSALNAMENLSIKLPKSSGERRREKAVEHMSSSCSHVTGRSLSEYCSDEADDESREWNSVPGIESEIEERHASCNSASTANLSQQQMSELESTLMTGLPLGPVYLGPGGSQRGGDNSSVMPFAFYPTGPPVPFLTMLPVYDLHPETDSGEASVGHLDDNEAVDINDSSQNTRLPGGFHSLENVVGSSFNNCVSIDSVEQHRSDILNSDFASHWHNLQYGRFCQSPRFHGSMVYPSPVVVPPLYLQGRIPWDGPGRPVNVNLLNQLVSYGPQFVPIASLQSVPNRSTGVHHHYTEEVPRHRSGTGTYLPNPKAAAKDRNSSNARCGSYNYDKPDHYGDRDWNSNVKSRPTGRFHNRNYEKQTARTANDVRGEKSWGSYRQNTFVQHRSHSGILPANNGSVAYGLYPLNNGGMSSTGPAVPSVVMLYPLDHNDGYTSGEQLEFGSLGQVGFFDARDACLLDNACQARDVFKEQRFHVNSAQHSPDQPSSPRAQRGI